MKKTVLVLMVAVMVFGTMGIAFADASWGPATIFAGKTEITEDEAYELKVEKDMTFGDMAKDAGFYEEFKAEALAKKAGMIAQMVADGKMTQEKADEVFAAFKECDGTQKDILKGTGMFGQKIGNGEGQRAKDSNGQGNGLGAMDGEGFGAKGSGNGQGNGQMRRDGKK